MIRVVEAGASSRTLEFRSIGRAFEVVLEGRRLVADLVQACSTWSLLIGEAPTGPLGDEGAGAGWPMESFEVTIEDHPGQPSTVWVGGCPVAVSLDALTRRGGGSRRRVEGDGPAGRRSIVAPMPGRIVEVLVAVGDPVVAHQGLVVVEAMKMENELRAPRNGTVTEVRVAKGALVEANAVLVVVE